MRKIAHLSDVHFGTVDERMVDKVVASITALEPDVVVVSGDLTQRALTREFRAARAFLDRLPHPQIVVPGNHDIPFYNVVARFLKGLEKYERYITADLAPTYEDAEMIIVGLNTARSLTLKGGRVNVEQVDYVRSKMCDLGGEILKIVVTHHPFDLAERHNESDIVGRAEKAIRRIADCGGDVFLSGHLHVSNIDTTAKRYKLADGRIAVIVQAGTATSSRMRGEAHSFNLIEFNHPQLCVQRYECLSLRNGFEPAESKTYRMITNGWERLDNK